MDIRPAAQEDKAPWDQYVLNHPDGIAYQLFAWKEAVKNAYGFKSCYLTAWKNKRIKGVLPLIEIKKPFLKPEFVSLPYCDAGGPLADDPVVEKLLIEQALKLSNSYHSKRLIVRSTREFADLDPDTTVNPEKTRMILSLPTGSDKLLASLKAKVRSQVKKAYKNGLTSKLGSINLLDDFYVVFSENMRDLGSPVHSRKWIYSILKFYGNKAHVSVVYMPTGEPAAAGIVFCHPSLVSIPWASSLRRFNKVNPNMMLYWRFLKFASDSGYPAFDFGRSTPGEGTYRFKKQWGAKPQNLHWADFIYSDKNTSDLIPIVKNKSQINSNARAMIEILISKMPVSFSNVLGNNTRKYISL